ncbi:ABC transporter permease [bacterium]|nr:ABC transporter permease [bacterium]
MMRDISGELGVALRVLWKRPGFSAVVILTLALGIGASSATFTVINSVLLKPLPYGNPDKMVLIPNTNRDASGKLEEYGTSISDFLDWKDRSKSFAAMGAMIPMEMALTGSGTPEQLDAGQISANLFSTLEVQRYAGRFFTEEEQVENSPVAILSHNLWTRRFGGAADVIGQTIIVDGIARQIVGIAPPGFFFSADSEFWTPLNLSAPRQPRSPVRNVAVAGRLKEGVTVAQAAQEMSSIAEQLSFEFPETNTGWSVTVLPIREPLIREVRGTIVVLMAAAAFLLLIAWANAGNLVLVRGLERRSELAVRRALGAARRHLIQQYFLENLIMSLSAGILGLLFSIFALRPIAALSPLVSTSPGGRRILSGITPDFTVVLFALGISVLTGIGLTFLFLTDRSGKGFLTILKSGGGRATEGRGDRRAQSALIIAEIAVALLLSVGAGLMIRSYNNLRNVHPGFHVEKLLTAKLNLPASRYESHTRRTLFMQELLREVNTIPGVTSASATTRLPLNSFAMTTFYEVEGADVLSNEQGFVANFRRISPAYFHTIGTTILEGREFTSADNDSSVPVALVSREMARRFWPLHSAIGKRIQRKSKSDRVWRTIIGVVDDVKDGALSEAAGSTLYIPDQQGSIAAFHLVIRTSGVPASLISILRERIWRLDKDLPVYRVITAEEMFSDSLSRPRFAAVLLGTLACLGLGIALLGIYGVISYSTARKSHEIGLRIALGARPQSVLHLILKQALKLTLWGIAIGMAASVAADRLADSLWYGAGNYSVFLIAPPVLIIVSMLASLAPALRATRVDPAISLRYE